MHDGTLIRGEKLTHHCDLQYLRLMSTERSREAAWDAVFSPKKTAHAFVVVMSCGQKRSPLGERISPYIDRTGTEVGSGFRLIPALARWVDTYFQIEREALCVWSCFMALHVKKQIINNNNTNLATLYVYILLSDRHRL